VVLAPTANLHRTPYEGRHFEYLSEDPVLAGAVAAALVGSIQSHGVAACVKHFVANESETQRTTYVARVDERTLREVYLAPFEAAVAAGAWMVMAAYNGVDDGVERAPACEHHRLLTGVLKGQWGFDGVVVSDWLAATTTAATANAGLDLVMPGPGGPWSAGQLLAAVGSGAVAQRLIDDKVLRLLRLAGRVDALDGRPRRPAPGVDVRHELRRLAAGAMVVLRNASGTLPVAPAGLRRVALIGPNAADTFIQGSGSGYTRPAQVVSIVDGLRAALGGTVDIVVEEGCDGRAMPPPAAAEILLDARMQRLDGSGTVLDDRPVHRAWAGVSRLDPGQVRARYTATVELRGDGTHLLEVGVLGAHTTWVDGEQLHRERRQADAGDVLTSVNHNPPGGRTEVAVRGSRTVAVRVDLDIPDLGGFGCWTALVLRHRPPRPAPSRRIAAAARAAAGADLAVVVVGTNDEVESEGYDRTSLSLPGAQDDLVRAVAATGTPTVVVVNAGAPVLLPWLDEVDTVLWSWLPGQECGDALADALFGVTEPAGRLPWTLPGAAADVPDRPLQPVGGVLDYAEGVLVGHRAWDDAGLLPARPFGFGLGWTSWSFEELRCPPRIAPGAGVPVTVRARNTGGRRGRCVVQVYLEPPPHPRLTRPRRQLAGFGTVELDPGATGDVTVTVPARTFAVWDGGWRTPPGRYGVVVGSHSRDGALSAVVEVG
jgi:beta-glucosidase